MGAMNAASDKWKEFYLRFCHKRFLCESDQATFDARHRLMIGVYAYFMYRIALFLGMSEPDAMLLHNLILSGFVQLLEIEGIIILLLYGFASGRSDTLGGNSIIHWIMYVMAYIQRCRKDGRDLDLKRDLGFGFVGDDVLGASTFMCNTEFTKFVDSLGYKSQAARKDEDLRDDMTLGELTFLKRTFRLQGEKVFAPLDINSIYKSLCYRLEPCGVSPEQHMKQVVDAAQREMFLHGEQAFLDFQSRLKVAQVAVKVEFKYFSYQQLMDAYEKGSLETWAYFDLDDLLIEGVVSS
jgi:hypothetical protein